MKQLLSGFAIGLLAACGGSQDQAGTTSQIKEFTVSVRDISLSRPSNRALIEVDVSLISQTGNAAVAE